MQALGRMNFLRGKPCILPSAFRLTSLTWDWCSPIHTDMILQIVKYFEYLPYFILSSFFFFRNWLKAVCIANAHYTSMFSLPSLFLQRTSVVVSPGTKQTTIWSAVSYHMRMASLSAWDSLQCSVPKPWSSQFYNLGTHLYHPSPHTSLFHKYALGCKQ